MPNSISCILFPNEGGVQLAGDLQCSHYAAHTAGQQPGADHEGAALNVDDGILCGSKAPGDQPDHSIIETFQAKAKADRAYFSL